MLLSPFGFSPTGEAFNLTMEEVATSVAIALQADKLIFLTEMPGIREQQDDQWRVSVLLRRIGRKRVRAADFRWAAAEIRAWAKEHGLI